MPRIRWKEKTRIANKAVGLPGPDLFYAKVNREMEVSDEALKVIKEKFKGAFEVIDGPKGKAKSGTAGGGEK